MANKYTPPAFWAWGKHYAASAHLVQHFTWKFDMLLEKCHSDIDFDSKLKKNVFWLLILTLDVWPLLCRRMYSMCWHEKADSTVICWRGNVSLCLPWQWTRQERLSFPGRQILVLELYLMFLEWDSTISPEISTDFVTSQRNICNSEIICCDIFFTDQRMNPTDFVDPITFFFSCICGFEWNYMYYLETYYRSLCYPTLFL